MFVLSLSGTHLVAISLALAPLGASLLVTTSEEVALGALKFRFWAILAEMPFLLTVETCIFAACLYSIDVHGIRVPSLGPFHHSFLYELKKLFSCHIRVAERVFDWASRVDSGEGVEQSVEGDGHWQTSERAVHRVRT